MKRLVWLAILVSAFVPASAAEAREWTSADGRTLEAEYVGSKDGEVTIRRAADRRSFTLKLDDLSEADRKWIEEHELAKEEEALAENQYAGLATGEWERSEAHGMPFRFYAERRLLREEEETFPLVIFLHGRGGNVMEPDAPWEAQNFSQEDNYRKRRCYILVPQCPDDGSSWSGKNADAVLEIIDDLTKGLNIDEDRIYLTGYSMGGYGTFHLLEREPKLFAAGIPVAGGGNPARAEEFKDIPVWVFHGAKDEDVKVSQSRDMVEALEEARGTVKYTEWPEEGHGISGKVFSDVAVHEWLFEQSRK